MELNVKIKNISIAQALALKVFLKKMEYYGNIGHSQYMAFYADGDGNFHPKFAFAADEPMPEITDKILVDTGWKTIEELVFYGVNGTIDKKSCDGSGPSVEMYDFDVLSYCLELK